MEVFGSCSKYCTVKYAYSCIVFKYRVGSGSGPFCPDQVSVKKKVGIRSTALLRQLFPPCYHKNFGLTIKYQPEEGGWGIFYLPPPYGELRRLLPAGQWTGIRIHCPPVNGHGLETIIVMDQILYCHGEIYVRVQHNQLGMVPGQNL